MVKLQREFYTRGNVLLIARQLLGCKLVVRAEDAARLSGMIVETEAYTGPEDKASHAYGNRRTARTETMFGLGGTAYVYFIYGMYYQFNVVTNQMDIPHAVLLRALEPLEGIERMRERRIVKRDRDLTSGPGKLCQALGLNRSFNGEDLTGERVWIEAAEKRLMPRQIMSGPRIGIDYAEEYREKPWRFWIKDNPYVSRLR
ncbi:MAG: DNA-3-methyladenine glycosylase [Pyrinomonadaceae bacterium]|nr:DNA-3-methyladenine glycosylase [Pyrinomonadaceae bacterium]